MDEYTPYYIWLQQTLGYGSPKIRTVLRVYPDLKDFYETGSAQKRLLGCFTKSEINAFEQITLQNARVVIDRCARLDYNIITLKDPQYPQRLKEIYNPPCVLYVKGRLPAIDTNLCIAMVGTRTATREGVRTSFTFAAGLAKAGTVIISGGALGIDCASHRGVLQAGGITICVLGCGINYNYLSENAQMRSLIANKGAVISEYPPDTPPLPRNFPLRNRIISGLSNGVLVIEAGQKSGSLITADLALEQGRDVFAVPGSITSAVTQGSNSLIQQGAKAVTCYTDILEEYIDTAAAPSVQENVPVCCPDDIPTAAHKKTRTAKATDTPVPAQQKPSPALTEDISDDARNILAALSEIPVHTDTLSQKTNIPVNRVLSALTQLELFGLAAPCSGRRYKKA